MSTHDLHLWTAIPAGVVGLAVGSFMGVVVDRVPSGDSVARPASHCDSCGAELGARDNIPVISYLLLKGRCRSCKAPIPAQVLVIELVTAAVFVLVDLRVAQGWAVPAYCAFGAGAVALSAIDMKLRRLPTPIVYWTAAVGGVLLLLASAVTSDWNRLLEGAIGAAACFAVFFAIFFAVPKGMGFGDVRLAGLCGGFLGWLGLRVVPVGLLSAFVIAGVPALVLVILGKANRKSQFPFGPYLAAGALFGICAGPELVHLGLF